MAYSDESDEIQRVVNRRPPVEGEDA